MSPNIQSIPTPSVSLPQPKAPPVVVAMHPKHGAMQLQRIGNAAIAPSRSAVVLASPPGTLLSTLTVLPHLRLGLAQMTARGRGSDTSQGVSDPRSRAPFTSMDDFYRRLGAVRTAVGWNQWKAPSAHLSPPSPTPSSGASAPVVSPATTGILEPASAARSFVPPPAAPASAARADLSPPRTSTPVTAGTQHLDAAFSRIKSARRFWRALDAQAARPPHAVPVPRCAASSPVMRPSPVPAPAPQRTDAYSALPARSACVPPADTALAQPEPEPQPQLQPALMPMPSPELLQAMKDSHRVSPDMMRLEDLIRGRTPKPTAAMPHPWHHYPTRPQRSELHPFGIYQALHRLRG